MGREPTITDDERAAASWRANAYIEDQPRKPRVGPAELGRRMGNAVKREKPFSPTAMGNLLKGEEFGLDVVAALEALTGEKREAWIANARRVRPDAQRGEPTIVRSDTTEMYEAESMEWRAIRIAKGDKPTLVDAIIRANKARRGYARGAVDESPAEIRASLDATRRHILHEARTPEPLPPTEIEPDDTFEQTSEPRATPRKKRA